jgi:hypothetical protein
MDIVEATKLRSTIEELVLSNQIKVSFERPRSPWEHPLTLLFIGFLFTGVLGTWISVRVQSQQADREHNRRIDDAETEHRHQASDAEKERQRRLDDVGTEQRRQAAETEREHVRQAAETEREYQRQAADARHAEDTRHYQSSTKAVTDFSNSLYLRYVRADMVIAAIRRETLPQEIAHRKELYDESLVQQEANLLSSQLLIREALKTQEYDEWEVLYLQRLKPLLTNLDDSLTEATDAYLHQYKKDGKPPEINLSVVRSDYANVRNCEFSLVNGIFLTLSTRQYVVADNRRVISTQEQALDEVRSRCSLPRPK